MLMVAMQQVHKPIHSMRGATGSTRALRGGSWNSTGGLLRSAYRYSSNPSFRFNHMGFRLSLQKVPHVVELNSTVDLEMIWVEPGTFTMGQNDISNASPEHNVTLTKGFYLGKYEVTQAQYEAVMTGNTDSLSATPSYWPNNPNRPVEQVSWDDIQVFLTRLNAHEAGNIPAGWGYVLPTEAQWEYACRAGTTTAYSWGETISASDASWNHGADANQTENVGQYAANPWGFFDMHGNVWEWTADAWGTYASGAQTDPFNVGATGSYRVYRGGAWTATGTGLRSAHRNSIDPSSPHGNIGFRVGFKHISNPPTDLNSTALLTIAENQPLGTIVGEFNATDPEGGIVTFHLPEGENNNSLFSIDANGTLRSATIFDYENDPTTYTITVQAKDDYNISVEGNFTITLTDEDEVVYNPTTLDGALYTISNAGASEVLVVGPSNADFHITQTPTIPSDLNVTFLTRGIYLWMQRSRLGHPRASLCLPGKIFTSIRR